MKRQGDLLFVSVGEIPSDAKIQNDGVIAEGEITGHKHRISDGAKAALMIAAGVAYVKAMQETEVVHEEHGTISLPVGDWEVIRQREYEPDGWRQVVD